MHKREVKIWDTDLYTFLIYRTGLIILCVFFTASFNILPQKLYPVKIDGKYGFINSSGELVVQPEYIEFHHFSEGFVIVRKINNSGLFTTVDYGYLSADGIFRSEDNYRKLGYYNEGLAKVYKRGIGLFTKSKMGI
ncbi:MAG: WG repeat-containing protein [Ignavibacteriaceae bacterium]